MHSWPGVSRPVDARPREGTIESWGASERLLHRGETEARVTESLGVEGGKRLRGDRGPVEKKEGEEREKEEKSRKKREGKGEEGGQGA